MKCMVVAYDKNRAIGAQGGIPWMGKLPADMRHFRELTTNQVVIMGRNTYDSIGKPLPNRQNIIITRQNIKISNAEIAHTIDEAYELAVPGKDICIIGGGQVYNLAMNDVDVIYATEIDIESGGDVFFPQLSIEWRETDRQSFSPNDDNQLAYSFVTYSKRR